MSTQAYKCHICKVDYAYSEEEDLRVHLLYEHQFYLPHCSTQVAKQSNIDYDKIRKSFRAKMNELATRKDLFHNIPKKYRDELSSLIKFIEGHKHTCNLQKMEHTKKITKRKKTHNSFEVLSEEVTTIKREKYDLLSNLV